MSVKKNVELIQAILANLEKRHDSTHEQKLYELGYLIGLLARIADDDFYAYGKLMQEYKKITKQKWICKL